MLTERLSRVPHNGYDCILKLSVGKRGQYECLKAAFIAKFGKIPTQYLKGFGEYKKRENVSWVDWDSSLLPSNLELSYSFEETLYTPKCPNELLPGCPPVPLFTEFALTVMIFVNYGGGGYWFFEHAPWNGLTVADLVMPWFVFIIGTSVALAFSAMIKRGVTRLQLVQKITWRTIVLMLIGLCFLNYGPADGPLSWSWARIPGVLQRLAFTYFTIGLMQTCFGKDVQACETVAWWAPVRDLVCYWPEWICIALLETLWLGLTFLLSVPGCPTGYLGPGGIGDQGRYPTCTGGAAAYIDKWLLGKSHIYGYPTCKELYKTTEPFDPEGVLGTINSVLMAFFGLQAGKIILIYRKQPCSILKRFAVWASLLGIISAILTKCSRDEGFIPVNKNLWSLSFVTTLGCFSFVVLGLMFYVIDVKHWWGGQPFIFPGMNSIFVYVGHSLLGSYFPFNWEMKSWTSHTEPLSQDLLGTSIWVFVAYLLFRKKFFLKI
ncbi:heparan-alpha-glucosaminide N-acetyltransferase-like [Ambystoma mexicanum]|uniref:heparan-alpha-glucosaminide N-acetyltransferase-like n=1 Tax=Ambystoma mexicanum TaxID=8296 RepID=UPI0037E736AA